MTKETDVRMRWQSVEWEKIFAEHLSGKGFIPKIYKILLQINRKENGKNKHTNPK
jgi:hypothetical protein